MEGLTGLVARSLVNQTGLNMLRRATSRTFTSSLASSLGPTFKAEWHRRQGSGGSDQGKRRPKAKCFVSALVGTKVCTNVICPNGYTLKTNPSSLSGNSSAVCCDQAGGTLHDVEVRWKRDWGVQDMRVSRGYRICQVCLSVSKQQSNSTPAMLQHRLSERVLPEVQPELDSSWWNNQLLRFG